MISETRKQASEGLVEDKEKRAERQTGSGIARLTLEQIGNASRAQLRLLPTLISLPLGLLLWKLISLPYPSSILPAPEVVAARWWAALLGGVWWKHGSVSVLEALLGFALAFVCGSALAYPLARSRMLERLLAPYIAATQAVPVVAIAPLMVLWFGFGLLPKVLTCALIVFFPILVSTMVGLRSVDKSLVEAAQTFGANRWQILWYVEAPLSLRSVLGGLKLGLTLALTGAIVGEFIAADAGLGFLLQLSRGVSDTPLLFATLVTLASLAGLAYGLVTLLERWLITWE